MFVEFLFMDEYGSRSETVEIDHSDPSRVELMDGAVGFRFCETLSDELSDVDDYDLQVSLKRSNWYFNGIRLTADEVIEQYGSNSNYAQLINNIKQQNIGCVCLTPFGNFIKMNDNDIVISELSSRKTK